MLENFIFTSESVTAGHPDKLCDQISDAIVDYFLQQDPFARTRAEWAISSAIVSLLGDLAGGLPSNSRIKYLLWL